MAGILHDIPHLVFRTGGILYRAFAPVLLLNLRNKLRSCHGRSDSESGRTGHPTRRQTSSRFGRTLRGRKVCDIFPDTDQNGSIRVAEELRKAVFHLRIIHGESVTHPFVTVSLGVASVIPLQRTNGPIVGGANQACRSSHVSVKTLYSEQVSVQRSK